MAKVITLYKEKEPLLIKKASKGNRLAQQLLYNQYAPKMLGVCRRYITDLQHAEEVLLNGFFKVFTQLRSFKAEGSFEGWVHRIMVREAISYLRSTKKVEFLTDEMSEFSKQTSSFFEDSVIDVEQIQLEIDKLAEGYKMVFVLYAIEGYKHHEIASMLNITVGTSKSQLFKARKILKEQLAKLKLKENGSK